MLVPLLIPALSSEMRAESECRNVPVEIEEVESVPRITSKPVQTIEMDWLSQQLGQIDCAKKFVSLTSPSSEQVCFSPKLQGPHLFALEANLSLKYP